MNIISKTNIDKSLLRVPIHVKEVLSEGELGIYDVLELMANTINASADEVNNAADWLNEIVDAIAGNSEFLVNAEQLYQSIVQQVNDIKDIVDGFQSRIDGKVDKVEGKQLSTEDFTTALKNKLNSLENYNDTEIRRLITNLQNALNGSSNTTEAIDSLGEIIVFLRAYKNTETLASVLSDLKTNLKTWVEGKGYLTTHQSLDGKVDKVEGSRLMTEAEGQAIADLNQNFDAKNSATTAKSEAIAAATDIANAVEERSKNYTDGLVSELDASTQEAVSDLGQNLNAKIDQTRKEIEAELMAKIAATNQRRTRLASFDLATLKKAVADQNLEKYGLKVGDQTTINGRTYVIAGLNTMRGANSYRVTKSHVGLICIPHTTQAWNASGKTNEGADGRGAGYANSDLHYYLKNTLLPLVQTDLGAANLIAHQKLLSAAVNTAGYNRMGSASGCSSSWAWEANSYISALSEVQVYGATVWSSSGFDTGEACRQLDVFRVYNHTEIFGGEYPWLRDVVSASSAANAVNNGYAYNYAASNAYYVAALILFN